MTIVGEVGYVDPVNSQSFPAGHTHVNWDEPADADGYLHSVTVYGSGVAGTIKISSWEQIGGTWHRRGFVNVNIPATVGLLVLPLPTPLHFVTGWHIGYYSDVVLYGGGGSPHGHTGTVGDVNILVAAAKVRGTATLWGELLTPPPSLGRPFYMGVP